MTYYTCAYEDGDCTILDDSCSDETLGTTVHDHLLRSRTDVPRDIRDRNHAVINAARTRSASSFENHAAMCRVRKHVDIIIERWSREKGHGFVFDGNDAVTVGAGGTTTQVGSAVRAALRP